jgi:hypothetical protein
MKSEIKAFYFINRLKKLIEIRNILNSKDLMADLAKLMPKEAFSANEAGEIRNMAIRLQKVMQVR